MAMMVIAINIMLLTQKKKVVGEIRALREPTVLEDYQKQLVAEANVRFMIKVRLIRDIEFVLSFRTDRVTAHKIAVAVVNYSLYKGFDPWLVLGIINVENYALKPKIVNSYGAVGLMQVVERFHWGKFTECKGNTLQEIETNICYGISIYSMYLNRLKNERLALWGYNGCTKARRNRNERCLKYPDKVFSSRDRLIAMVDD